MIWINFKTYPEATGAKAVALAKICFSVSAQTGVPVYPVVQAVDAYRVYLEAGSPVWVQHVDCLQPGRHTGWVVPEAVSAAGAEGTLLNHSEHKLPAGEIGTCLEVLRLRNLQAMVCCSSLAEGELYAPLKPGLIAYEPPELIANQKVSVATARAEVVADFVNRFPELPVVIGAGIQSARDVIIGLKLGAKGFLISSAVVKATDPQGLLFELAKACKM